MNGNQQYCPELDGYGDGYAPEHGFAPDIKTVPDGSYDCQFGSAEMSTTSAGHVARVALHIGGRVIQHTYWLNSQQSVNSFAAEMTALGFPTNTWGKGGIPLGQAIPQAVAQLPGIRFRAVKSSRPGKPPAPGQPAPTFHDLHISGRLGASTPMPSVAHSAVVPQQPAPQYQRQAAPVPAAREYDDIPF